MRIPPVVLLLFSLFNCTTAFAQDDSQIRSILSQDDLKKLSKAEKHKSDADNLISGVNLLNLEIIELQSAGNVDEKSGQKKIKDLENKSIQDQITAAGLYEKCNEIKFGVYKKNIDEFRKRNPDRDSEFLDAKLLEEQAGEEYFQAASYRVEAKRLVGYVKIEKLNEAFLLENQALQKQVSALGLYFSIPEPAASADNPVDESLDNNEANRRESIEAPVTGQDVQGRIVVNQLMIDSYNRYMAVDDVSDTTLSTGKIAAVTSFDREELLRLWYEYIYDIRDTSVSRNAEQNEIASEEISDDHPASDPVIREGENESVHAGIKGAPVYRVQIAANRGELSQRALSRIYYGTKKVEVVNENGWHKYSVGDFATYEEADEFRKSSGIKNAFVIAFNGESKAAEITPSSDAKDEVYSGSQEITLPPGLLFRVQIAASRAPLSTGHLAVIYKGNYPVEVISEDGWYKYQLLGVRLYSDSRRILSSLGNKGFIVAYDDGKKANLADAIDKNKALENESNKNGRKGIVHETEFHVQLAASKKLMSGDELKALYNGPEPVSVLIDEGWYKYHLKAGNSYQRAKDLLQNCNVSGAFIVAYVRALKTETYKALQQNQ